MHTSVSLLLNTDTRVAVAVHQTPFGASVAVYLDDEAQLLSRDPDALEALAAALIGAANELRSKTDDAAGEAGDSTDRPSAEQPEAASSPHVSEVGA